MTDDGTDSWMDERGIRAIARLHIVNRAFMVSLLARQRPNQRKLTHQLGRLGQPFPELNLR